MLDYEMKDLLERFEAGDLHEDKITEFKSSETDCAKLYDTLSSFSNQDMGGVIICGIDEKENLICGIQNPDLVVKKIQAQCENMTPQLHPIITTYSLRSKTLIFIEVPGLPISQRPCFKTAIGIEGSSYVRVGEADQRMSAYEIFEYQVYNTGFDAESIELDLDWKQLITSEFYILIQNLKDKSSLLGNEKPEEALTALGLAHSGKATLVGALALLDFPTPYYPGASIKCAQYSGTKKITNEQDRIANKITIIGCLRDQYKQMMTWLKNVMRSSLAVDKNTGETIVKYEYPEIALREIVINALVHRDYSEYFRTEAIRVDMYSNRIEIISPGGVNGNMDIEFISRGNIPVRNRCLLRIAQLLDLCEDRHTGIYRANKVLEFAGLPPLKLEVRNGYFIATIYNGRDTGTSKTQVF